MRQSSILIFWNPPVPNHRHLNSYSKLTNYNPRATYTHYLQIPFTISTAEVGVIERFGKFTRLATPGLGFVLCGIEQLVGRMSYRVQQLDVRVETKTLDNVFITAVVSIQYQVLQEKVYEAFYALTDPSRQITAHVFDVLRAELPNLELDSVFEAKEDLALSVKNALTETMTKVRC